MAAMGPPSPAEIHKQINRFDAVVVTTAVFLATSTLSVGLRTYVRACVTKTFGWDDATMLASWVLFLVVGALTYVTIHYLRHFLFTGTLGGSMTPDSFLNVLRFANATYSLDMIVVKISIGLFFLKVFAKTTSESFRCSRSIIFLFMGISTLIGVIWFIMTFATCGPTIYSPLDHGNCAFTNTFIKISTAWSFCNAFNDAVFTALGVFAISKAKLSMKIKISAGLLLVIGSVSVVASCARIATQIPASNIQKQGILLVEWSNIEAGLCITAGSLVTLRPLARRFFSFLRDNTTRNGSTYGGGSVLAQKSHGTHLSENFHTRSIVCPDCADLEDTAQGDDKDKDSSEGVFVTTTTVTNSRSVDLEGSSTRCPHCNLAQRNQRMSQVHDKDQTTPVVITTIGKS